MPSDAGQWTAICLGIAGVFLILFLSFQIGISYGWNGETVVTTTRLRLRAWPTTSSDVLATIDRDVPVLVLGRFSNWLKVEHEGQIGFVHGDYVLLAESEPTTVPTSGQARGLRSEHRCLLEQTGWLNYVLGNLDEVAYFPWPAFDSSAGPAIGLANYENGMRIAQIATEGRDDMEITTTIVHEAAHLAGISETGNTNSERAARRVEQQFIHDLRTLGDQACEGVPNGR